MKKTPIITIVGITILVLLVGIGFILLSKEQETTQPFYSNTIIPENPFTPSPDQIITDVNGIQHVKNVIVVVFDFDTPNPEDRIKEIASSTKGVIVGAVPELLIYQIRYDVTDFGVLDPIISQINGMPYVINASYDTIVQYL